MPNVFMETLRFPAGRETMEDAIKDLEEIRNNHPESYNWREIDAGVEQRSDGRWYAWRKHEHFL